MRSRKNRWITALAVVPSGLVALAAFGTPVQAAGTGAVADTSGGAGPLDRAELGLAMVTLGILIFALTVVRLRMKSQARSYALRRSSWARITDTYAYTSAASRRRQGTDTYTYSGMSSRRTSTQPRW